MNFKCHFNIAKWRMRSQQLRVKGGHVRFCSPTTLCYLYLLVSASLQNVQSSELQGVNEE